MKYTCIKCGHREVDNTAPFLIALNCYKCGGSKTAISEEFMKKSNVINGDALSALRKAEVDCVAHVCNNQKVMGSGFALQVKEQYPRAYHAYLGASMNLGNISHDDRIINLVAQDNFRNNPEDTRRFLNYGALSESLIKTRHLMVAMSWNSIAFPFMVGSDRAGGDFEIVAELIHFHFGDMDVRFYKL